MEISNRTLVIVSASIILFGVSMRVQSGSASNSVQNPPSSGTLQPNRIPDSDFKMVGQYQNVSQKPTESNLGGTPNQNLIKLNQGGAIVPGVTRIVDASKPIAGTQPAGNTTAPGSMNASGGLPAGGDIGVGIPNATTGNSALDAMTGSLSDEDQAAFAAMWSSLTPAQRELFVARLQQNR